jgi:hypothetical protein
MRNVAIYSFLLLGPVLSHAQIGSAGIGGFGGPSVLGRGAASGTGRSGEAGFRYYLGATAAYDTGLTGFALDENGNVQNAGSKGVEGIAGVYGSKRSRRSLVSLNYQGSYRHYTNIRGFSGTDQNITASFSKQINARTALGVGATAGTTNRAFGLNGINGFIDPNLIGFGLPTAEVFDNRIYYGSGSVNYIWQKSSRSSLSLLGNTFLTRRSGRVLFGVNGAGAGADYGYRLSRNQLINVSYNYFLFNFTRGFGDSHGHSLSLGYSARIARRYELSLRVGATRLESLFLQKVDVDPVIAAIVGITSTQTVAHNVRMLPNAALNFTGPLTRRSSFGVTAGHFVLPGNGIVSTARNWNLGANYGYAGLRRVSLGASLVYNKLSSVIGPAQTFGSVIGTGSASSRVAGDLFATLNAGTRRFLEGPTNNFQRNSYFVSLGLFWSPGETPLNFR